ncbi:MAG: PrsW family intramembrane metalloprotease [Lachnospiraceae bacterium]|nr:PrsW family intramembrane metalloprotease [Lachnospiraceae bacterium]
MTYIENVYICLAAPLLIALIATKQRDRRMVGFLLSGMTVCLLSSYISTFLARVNGISMLMASLTVSPIVEEITKLLPVFFYLVVFEPDHKRIPGSVVFTAVGFATFENVCFMTQNGTEQLFRLLIRGFGTGAMHVVCASLVSLGMLHLLDNLWLRVAGTFGLIAVAITYHGIYNLLVSQVGPAAYVGYVIPIITAAAYIVLLRLVKDDLKTA